MKKFKSDEELKEGNAAYLDARLSQIPGIIPHKPTKGAEKAAFHIYPFRYTKKDFNNISRDTFLKALRAEGIPGRSGYGQQNKDGLIVEAFSSRGYQRLFDDDRLNKWREENILTGNDQLCEEAVAFSQNVLLGSKEDMDDIVNAISKIYENRYDLG